MRPVLAVCGPTGSGKSSLAVVLAERLGGEIVNFDSLQVYRGFNIGTAKISHDERARVPHHLIDIRDPESTYTAGEFARDAKDLLPRISARGRLPILCGGTGFYLRALLRGLSPVPMRSECLRDRLAEREQRRPGSVRKLLERLDSQAAARIHPNDLNKSIRALEIRLLTRRSSKELFHETGLEPLHGYRPFLLALSPPRVELYERLDARCESMWRGGLVPEVRHLLESGVSPEAKPFESLGYKQVIQYLRGEYTEKKAIEEMKIRTRQYAKRQWTWFRAEKHLQWFEGFGTSQDLQGAAVGTINAWLRDF